MVPRLDGPLWLYCYCKMLTELPEKITHDYTFRLCFAVNFRTQKIFLLFLVQCSSEANHGSFLNTFTYLEHLFKDTFLEEEIVRLITFNNSPIYFPLYIFSNYTVLHILPAMYSFWIGKKTGVPGEKPLKNRRDQPRELH